MSFNETLKSSIEQIKWLSKTDTIFGDPIEIGGSTLVPVSKVSAGFAAGGSGAKDGKDSGAGTGGGVQITPVALISVKDGKVSIHSLQKGARLGDMLAKTPELFDKLQNFLNKDKPGESKGAGDKGRDKGKKRDEEEKKSG
ncbi:MAG: GerW family sporulation protein [Chitinivibrionales bacterium]